MNPLPNQSERATFSLSIRTCMNDGLCTPPLSPVKASGSSSNSSSSNGSRLARLLRRKSIFVPPPGNEHLVRQRSIVDCDTSRRPSTASFRMLKNIARPFALPASPALSEEHDDPMANSRLLRSVPSSYRDLRNISINHSATTSRRPPQLLPSPVMDTIGDARLVSYFASRHSKTSSSDQIDVIRANSTYEDHCIVSGYFDDDNDNDSDEKDQGDKQVDERRDSFSNSSSSSSSSSSDECATTSHSQSNLVRWHIQEEANQERREREKRTLSSESDWLADTKSHSERLSRFQQRCFQVVQYPGSRGGGATKMGNDGNYQIMLATILIGPGKPKLVHIPRPLSSSTTSTNGTSKRPFTPVQSVREISAFSPYDTPVERSSVSATPTKQDRVSTFPRTTGDSLPPEPVAFASHRHAHIFKRCVIPRCDGEEASPAESHFTSASSSSSSSSKTAATSMWTRSSTGRSSPPRFKWPGNDDEKSGATAWRRCKLLERTLDVVTRAIESFPNGILLLDSPAVLELRTMPVCDDNTHLKYLRQIFPTTTTRLLSALGAWLIVDAYFTGLLLDITTPVPPLAGNIANSSSSDDMMMLLRGGIPAKACLTLGIHLPTAAIAQAREVVLRQRARLVQVSVEVIGQRLMEAVCGKWDETLWSSLRLLLEVVERGGGRES